MEAPRGVKRRLAAILSADAKGYSRLSTCRCFSFSADTITTWMPRSLHDSSMRCKRRSNAWFGSTTRRTTLHNIPFEEPAAFTKSVVEALHSAGIGALKAPR